MPLHYKLLGGLEDGQQRYPVLSADPSRSLVDRANLLAEKHEIVGFASGRDNVPSMLLFLLCELSITE